MFTMLTVRVFGFSNYAETPRMAFAIDIKFGCMVCMVFSPFPGGMI
jgi:hypothetical protein